MPISSPIYRFIRVFEGSPSSHSSTMSDELKSKTNSRRGYRSYVTKTDGLIDKIIADFNGRSTGGAGPTTAADHQQAVDAVIAHLQQIEIRWDNEDQVNSEILHLISDDAQLDRELEEQEAHKDERLVIRKKVDKFANPNTSTSSTFQSNYVANVSFLRPSSNVPHATYREPLLKKFDGDIYQWQPWWEMFEANVHNLNIPTRIKFAELDRYLDGRAAKTIEGIGRSEVHYETAIKLLKEAYEDGNVRIERLIDDLLELPSAHDQNNTKSLRALLDGIKINVRMLDNLGRNQSSYSNDVLRKLVSKLPREFAIAWNESINVDDANIEKLIEFLELRVKSREKYEFTHRATREEPQKKSESKPLKFVSTASTLVNVVTSDGNAKKLRDSGCHFCKGAHRPMECPLSIEKRYEAANRDRRCHNCLSVGHRVADCYPHNANCRNCSKRHHTALCRSGTNGPGAAS